jgi:hypothetical protein
LYICTCNIDVIVGIVEDIEDDEVAFYNCDSAVTWKDGRSSRYRVGRDGEVDIRFTKPAQTTYFEDHLQEITRGTFSYLTLNMINFGIVLV